MRKRIARLLDRLSVSRKLMVVYFGLMMIPLICFSFITSYDISRIVSDQTLSSARIRINESVSVLERELDSMIDAAAVITLDHQLYTALMRPLSEYSFAKQKEDHETIVSMLQYVQRDSDISRIVLYVSPRLYYADDTYYFIPLDQITGTAWYKDLAASDSNRIWCPPDIIQPGGAQNPAISYIRMLYETENLDQMLAVLRVDIPAATLLTQLENSVITGHHEVILMNDSEMILSSGDHQQDLEFSQLAGLLADKSPETWNSIRIGGEKSMALYSRISANGWYLVSVIPQSDITALGQKTRNNMLLFLVIISLLSYLLAYLISKSSVRRILLLTSAMKKVEDGNLNIQVGHAGNDEIGELTAGFNLMVGKMAQLIDEKFMMGQEIKSVEIKALQAQINPHFLYNTLDLINCTAIAHDVPAIADMVNSLSKFYKLGLSRGKDIILIRDELAHVSLYVKIQNIRFDHKIHFVVNVDEALYDCSTLKIILQPIVENAIMHGILEKETPTGQVTIFGRLRDNVASFTVEDDGIGMSEEKVRQVLSDDYESETHGGYGMKNIDRRLKLYYGSQYGLLISSQPGWGTRVTLTFPAVKAKI